jgi:hypothetical protein
MMNLEKYFKKYLWDDERTPYLVPVARMTRRQADYELHASCSSASCSRW